MTKAALVCVDAIRIQSYLTAGGRLRDLAGGSRLVESFCDTSAGGMLHRAAQECSLELTEPSSANLASVDSIKGKLIVLRSSGGAVHAIAPSIEIAKKLTGALTLSLLAQAPGLHVIATVDELKDWNAAAFQTAWKESRERFSEEKQDAAGAWPFSAPFVARCEATGLPASGHDSKGRRLNEHVCRMRDAAEDANELLARLLGERREEFAFPLDTDDLCKKGGGYVGVIHLDGNNIGRLLSALSHSRQTGDIGTMLAARREVSIKLDKAAEGSFACALDAVLKWFDEGKDKDEGKGKIVDPASRFEFALERAGRRFNLPLRPLVLGGDDLTLVCEGQIAIPLAIELIRGFEKRSADAATQLTGTTNSKLTACAGVAIVKKHFPFGRAYELAEELMKNAKERARGKDGRAGHSFVDFEVVSASQLPHLKDARESKPRRTRKPYEAEELARLLEKAKIVMTRLPRRQVKAIAEAVVRGPAAANTALSHLKGQLERKLPGHDYMSAGDLKPLLGGSEDLFVKRDPTDETESTDWLDCIEVARFFPRVNQDSSKSSSKEASP